MEKKKLILFDLDGTLYDFRGPDNEVIKKLFGEYKVVMFLDKILWLVNSLDFFSNKAIIFKLRMFIYSLLSFTSYSSNISMYIAEFKDLVKEKFIFNYYRYLRKYKDIDTCIMLITHDDMFVKYFQKYVDTKIYVAKNKFKNIPSLLKIYDIEAIIGNNFCDDIATAYHINKIYETYGIDKRVKSIYVGKSKLVKKIVKNKSYVIGDISKIDSIL